MNHLRRYVRYHQIRLRVRLHYSKPGKVYWWYNPGKNKNAFTHTSRHTSRRAIGDATPIIATAIGDRRSANHWLVLSCCDATKNVFPQQEYLYELPFENSNIVFCPSSEGYPFLFRHFQVSPPPSILPFFRRRSIFPRPMHISPRTKELSQLHEPIPPHIWSLAGFPCLYRKAWAAWRKWNKKNDMKWQ